MQSVCMGYVPPLTVGAVGDVGVTVGVVGFVGVTVGVLGFVGATGFGYGFFCSASKVASAYDSRSSVRLTAWTDCKATTMVAIRALVSIIFCLSFCFCLII